MTSSAKFRRRAKVMRREPTEAERRLWVILRAKRLGHLKFRRQVPIGLYIADFVCFDLRLVIEADGGGHSENAYDDRRDAWLADNGFRVLRFWNNQILEEPDGVADRILVEAAEIRAASPPLPSHPAAQGGPLPSPTRGEGVPHAHDYVRVHKQQN